MIRPNEQSAREDIHEAYDHCARRGRHIGRGVLPSSAQAHCSGCGVAAGVSADWLPAPSSARQSPIAARPMSRPHQFTRRRPPPMSHRQRCTKATSATSSIAAFGWKATAGGRAASRSATDVRSTAACARALRRSAAVDFQSALLLIRAERRAREHSRLPIDLVLVEAERREPPLHGSTCSVLTARSCSNGVSNGLPPAIRSAEMADEEHVEIRKIIVLEHEIIFRRG